MLKKLLIVCTLVMGLALAGQGNVIAGGSPNIDVYAEDQTSVMTGNGYAGFGSYNNASLQFYGFGIGGVTTETEGFALASGKMVAEGLAYSGGISGVHSNAKAGAIGFGIGKYHLEVHGGAGAGSSAWAYKDSFDPDGTWAGGHGTGRASYDAGKDGRVFFIGGGELNGYAGALSGTIAFADKGEFGDTVYSTSGAFTANAAGAMTDAPYRNCGNSGWSHVNANGEGFVQHNTYASKNGSFATTYGEASFAYNNNGRNAVIGGGIAGTVGMSTVTQKENSVTAHSKSSSFAASTGGRIRNVD